MRLSIGIVCLLLLTACSPMVEKLPIAISDRSGDEPYQLEVSEEVFDGKKLFLELIVNEYTERNSNPAIITLKTVANGAPIGESFILLAKTEPGKPFRLSADAEHFTDYQVDVVWGQDARDYLKTVSPSKFITVKNVVVTAPDGNGTRKVQGEFHNDGIDTITSIPISLEFQWVTKGEYLDLSALSPENVNELDVPDISIEAGASKPFSIEISTPLPEPQDGAEQTDGSIQSSGTWQAVVKVR